MPLYNAQQILGRTISFDRDTKVYKVFDINNLGDNASPSSVYRKGQTVQIDSYLSPTPAYTSAYGIRYAKRSSEYFTFYAGSVYMAFKNDSSISKSSLQQQGAKTVVQEMEEERRSKLSFFEKLKEDILKLGKPVLIAAIVLIALYFSMPYIMEAIKKRK